MHYAGYRDSNLRTLSWTLNANYHHLLERVTLIIRRPTDGGWGGVVLTLAGCRSCSSTARFVILWPCGTSLRTGSATGFSFVEWCRGSIDPLSPGVSDLTAVARRLIILRA